MPPALATQGWPRPSGIRGCFSGALRTWETSFLVKASPFGRGVTAGDGEGKDGTIGPLHSDKQALCQREAIAAFVPLCPRPCPLRRFAPALPKGEPLIHPLYLLCARPSLPSMMSLAAASRSGRRSARALASSGGNLPSTQSARS